MKKSLLVLSAASLAASSAVAGTYISTTVNAKDPCTVTATAAASKLTMPKSCAPEVTFYITGATAQAGYVTGATGLQDRWFESGYFTILEGDGTNATAITSGRKTDSNARGWYGIGKANTAAAGKRLYVAYHPKGSIEGVMQVMSSTATEPEATVFYPGSSKCVVSATSSLTYYCGQYQAVETDLALSDVKPQEGDLVWMKAANGGKTLPKFDSSALLSTPVGLQAFGLIVNNAFYKALQDRDIARGFIPASCSSEGSASTYAASSVTSACRPTMARHEYASLIAANGAKDLTFLLGAGALAAKVVVDRRYGGSGTQASSNVYFLNNPCGGRGLASATAAATDGLGLNITTADAVVTGTYGGGLIPRSGTPVTSDPSGTVTGTAYGNILVVEWTSSSGTALKSAYGVGSTADYHIGVASANADDGSTWKYLKLDGVDPIGTATGAKAAAPFTDNLRNGLYPFSMVFYTVVTQAAAKKKSTDTLAKMADELTITLKVPTVNLSGIAALPENSASAVSTMKGILSRAGNNNCAPLKVTTN
jgi:hypothetical protein